MLDKLQKHKSNPAFSFFLANVFSNLASNYARGTPFSNALKCVFSDNGRMFMSSVLVTTVLLKTKIHYNFLF